MTKIDFEQRLSRACNMVMEALDSTNSLLAIYEDTSVDLGIDQKYVDAGSAIISIGQSLGSGPNSSRAKINRIRM